MNNIISGIVLISLLAPIALPVAPAIRDKISAPYSVGDAATLDDVIAASDAILLCTVTKGGSRVEGEERTLNTIKFLREHGYALQEATPVDMFPHTAEVEVVSCLVREEA